jgi:alkylation response protein AidB-like acyl-CoA dehydrogenase
MSQNLLPYYLRHRLTLLLFCFAAGLRTTAELSEDGSHYIVNGTKKWISNAIWSDYIVTGCRTKKGFTVLLVEKQEGIDVKLIKTSYSMAAATSFIEFDNVKVPAKNLLGEEDKGFVVIMSNFNHERW